MTACRKSFMPECEYLPECEYFTTGGCVSPFNCPYKIENKSITTATSTPCNLYPLETDKDREIARLQADNAELRERLDKAMGLPYMYEAELVDSAGHFLKTIYIVLYNNNGTIRAIQYSYKKVAEARLKDLAVCGGDKG